MEIKPINPKKRLMVGRAQRKYKNTYQLLKVIKAETSLWAGLVALAIVNIIVVLLFVLQSLGLTFSDFISLLNNTAEEGLAEAPGNNGFYIPNNPTENGAPAPVAENSGLSPFEIILIFVAARVLFNIIMSIIIKWGMIWYQDFVNHFAIIINGIASAFTLIVTSIIMISINGFIYSNISSIILAHKIAFNSELSTTKAKGLILILDFDVLLAYVIFLFIVISVAINVLRSIIAFVNSFNLLPPPHKIDRELRIVSFHSSDLDYIKELYIQSSNANDKRLTDRDFEQFMKVYDINNFRVLLRKGVPVGFYTTGEERTILEEVIIAPEYRNQGLGELLLKDFEIATIRRKPTTLTARFYSDDLKTAEYLTNQGWAETGRPGMNQKEFQKTVQKGKTNENILEEAPLGLNAGINKKPSTANDNNETENDSSLNNNVTVSPKVHDFSTVKNLKKPVETRLPTLPKKIEQNSIPRTPNSNLVQSESEEWKAEQKQKKSFDSPQNNFTNPFDN